MVRAARKLLSAITKVLLIADKVIVKQLLTSKDKVRGVPEDKFKVRRGWAWEGVSPPPPPPQHTLEKNQDMN